MMPDTHTGDIYLYLTPSCLDTFCFLSSAYKKIDTHTGHMNIEHLHVWFPCVPFDCPALLSDTEVE